MFWIFLILIVLLLIHREILFALIAHLGRARPIEFGTWDIGLRAKLKEKKFSPKVPEIFALEIPFLECCVIQTLKVRAVFVAKDLWESLSVEERETLQAWGYSSLVRYSALRKILGPVSVETLDRDAAWITSKPLSFVSLFDKMTLFREKHPPSGMGSLITGLTLLGPSLLIPWLSYKERMSAYTKQLERLG